MEKPIGMDPASWAEFCLAIRGFALFEANRTVARTQIGDSHNDGLVIRVAQRYEHYIMTGEVKEPAS